MGLIEAYRKFPIGCLLALAAVAITLLVSLGVSGTERHSIPGYHLQVIQVVLAVCAGAVFAYAIRPGNSRAGWLIWWIPVVLTLISIPFQQLLEDLLAPNIAFLLQAVFFLSWAWLVVLTAPLAWLVVILPLEFLLRAARGLVSKDRRLVLAQLSWGSLIGAVTLGSLLLAALRERDGMPSTFTLILNDLVWRYPDLSALIEIILLFGPPVLGALAVIGFAVSLARPTGRAHLADATVLSAPFLHSIRDARRQAKQRTGAEFTAEPAVKPTSAAETPPSHGRAWSPVWLWRATPGGVLLAVSVTVITFCVAALANSEGTLRSVLMPLPLAVERFPGPFTWALLLGVLTGIVFAAAVHGRNFQKLWILAWLAALVTVSVAAWQLAVVPFAKFGDAFTIAFVAVLSIVLSCLSWLFLVVPVQTVAASTLRLLSGSWEALGGVLLGLCLGCGGIAIVSGYLSVEVPYGAGMSEHFQSMLTAMVGLGGNFTVTSEPLLWTARLAILGMVICGLGARIVAGGRASLQHQLLDSTLGPTPQQASR